jgi:translocator protein
MTDPQHTHATTPAPTPPDVPSDRDGRAERPPTADVATDQVAPDDAVADDAQAGGATSRSHPWAALAGFGAIATATAVGGALVGPGRPTVMAWYRTLRKPPFTPPSGLFGPVWTLLYALIAVSGWRVWRRPDSPERTRALALWAAQMAANAAWTPLFFGARRPTAALVDLGAQVAATAGYVAQAARVDTPAAALMAPYLGWTTFAGVLNTEIVRRNR